VKGQRQWQHHLRIAAPAMNQDHRALIKLSRDQPGKQSFVFQTRQVLTTEGQRETFRRTGFD